MLLPRSWVTLTSALTSAPEGSRVPMGARRAVPAAKASGRYRFGEGTFPRIPRNSPKRVEKGPEKGGGNGSDIVFPRAAPSEHAGRTPRDASLLRPSGLAQTFKHVGVVFRPSPGGALSYIEVERSRGDGDCLLQRLPRLINPAELA